MKILTTLLFLFYISTAISQVNDTVESATYLAVKTVTSSIDPNELIDMECGDWKLFAQEVSCLDEELYDEKQAQTDMDLIHDESVRVPHCDNSKDNNRKFCFTDENFTSYILKDDKGGANRLLMSYLCNNKSTDKGIKIAFGPCTENQKGQQLKSSEMSCYCQFINGQKSESLAWHCTGVGE